MSSKNFCLLISIKTSEIYFLYLSHVTKVSAQTFATGCKRRIELGKSLSKFLEFIKIKYFTLTLKLIKSILINYTGKFCFRHRHYQDIKAYISKPSFRHDGKIWKIPRTISPLECNFRKVTSWEEAIPKTVLHHECFCEMFQKFFDRYCELSIKGFSCHGRDEFKINHSV